MSTLPKDRYYTETHEWVQFEKDGQHALIGITDHAQASLGDITFIELPEPETALPAEAPFGVIESVKAASDLYMPISGVIVQVNEALEESPDLVNKDPYGAGWLVRIALEDPAEMEQGMQQLLSPEDYQKQYL